MKDLKQINGNLQKSIENVKELFELMGNLKGDDLINLRFKLRQMLRDLIEEIKVYPAGRKDDKGFRFYEVQLKGCRSFARGWFPEGYTDTEMEENGGFFPEFD